MRDDVTRCHSCTTANCANCHEDYNYCDDCDNGFELVDNVCNACKTAECKKTVEEHNKEAGGGSSTSRLLQANKLDDKCACYECIAGYEPKDGYCLAKCHKDCKP